MSSTHFLSKSNHLAVSIPFPFASFFEHFIAGIFEHFKMAVLLQLIGLPLTSLLLLRSLTILCAGLGVPLALHLHHLHCVSCAPSPRTSPSSGGTGSSFTCSCGSSPNPASTARAQHSAGAYPCLITKHQQHQFRPSFRKQPENGGGVTTHHPSPTCHRYFFGHVQQVVFFCRLRCLCIFGQMLYWPC
jgi:hypothetical protein